jgi:hypothetical protein
MDDPAPLTAEDIAELGRVADTTKRGLLLMAMVTERLPGHPPPVVVGGFAVEFYTTGGYRTGDLDVVYIKPERIGRILEGGGFKKINRHWVHAALGIQLEVPSLALERAEYARTAALEIGRRTVHLIGIEDLIADRLSGAVHGGSTDDLNWAAELIALHNRDPDLDLAYLGEQVRLQNLTDAYHEACRRAAAADQAW